MTTVNICTLSWFGLLQIFLNQKAVTVFRTVDSKKKIFLTMVL